MPDKMRVVLHQHQEIFIHNDLSNTAHYFKKRIEERTQNDDREGIALEIMAALAMTAFAVEAKFNFLGWKLLGKEWDERQASWKKVKAVCKELDVEHDDEKRPFSTIKRLRDFRDVLAHGKPIVVNYEKEIIASPEELDEMGLLKGPWEELTTLEFLTQAFEDMNEVWQMLIKKADLEIFETLTHGMGGISFIEHVKA